MQSGGVGPGSCKGVKMQGKRHRRLLWRAISLCYNPRRSSLHHAASVFLLL